MIAIGAVRALLAQEISVPGQVSVTGFDNVEDGSLSPVALTTVHVPKEALGRRAVELLLQRTRERDEPKEKVLLACELLYRESSDRI
jgi:LacI family transcriptional regulator